MHAPALPVTAAVRASLGTRLGTFRRLGLVGALLLAASAPLHAAPLSPLVEATGTGSPVSLENYRAFLPKVYATANARPLEAAWSPTRKTLKEIRVTLDGAGDGRFVAQSVSGARTTLACPDGGTAVASRADASGVSTQLTVFRGCSVDGQRLDGPVSWAPGRSELAVFGTAIGPTQSKAFSRTDASGLATLVNGHRSASRTSDGGRSLYWSGDWGLKSGASTLAVSAMTLSAEGRDGNYRYKSDFRMSGAATNGMDVPVATFAPFENDYGPSFVRGYMQVLALKGPGASAGKIAISPAADAADAFDLRIDTVRAPGDLDTTEATVPQSFGGGPLKLGAR